MHHHNDGSQVAGAWPILYAAGPVFHYGVDRRDSGPCWVLSFHDLFDFAWSSFPHCICIWDNELVALARLPSMTCFFLFPRFFFFFYPANVREPNPLVNTPRRYICDPFSPYHTYIEVGQALSWTSPHFLLTSGCILLPLRFSLF